MEFTSLFNLISKNGTDSEELNFRFHKIGSSFSTKLPITFDEP